MTPEQKTLVRTTWLKVAPISQAAAGLFYDRLFELDPALRPMFAATDMDVQKSKLVQALSAVVGNLDRLETLRLELCDLGRRHRDYGATESAYRTVGAALIWTLRKGLGDDWSPDAEAAWIAAYGFVSQTMIAGAQSEPHRGVA